jgi:hypothetical protein
MLGLGLGALVAPPAPSSAQDAKVGAVPPGTIAIQETEEDRKDREARRQCAISLCSTLHNGKPAEGVVTCNLAKTLRKEVIAKVLARGKIKWPWGDTRCASEMKLDRALLVKAMREPQLEAQFETHSIRCRIETKTDKYEVTAQLSPKVTFKQGKATKAMLNWGKIEAPSLARTALWSITTVDNTFGVLRNAAVDDINDFIGNKCLEVKEEWSGK